MLSEVRIMVDFRSFMPYSLRNILIALALLSHEIFLNVLAVVVACDIGGRICGR